MSSPAEQLARALEDHAADHLVMVTGAGISVASGIPTFRGDDPGAVWKSELTELATYRFFRADPVASWTFTRRLFAKLPAARPNAAHLAVAGLESWQDARGGRVTLITQNVDTLHEQAGSVDLVKVHGSVDRLRCAAPIGCPRGSPAGSLGLDEVDFEPFFAAPSFELLPRCPHCGDLVRPHVLWFDELYASHDDYGWPRVQLAADDMACLLFVGTSFSVGVTEMLLQAGLARRLPIFSVDPVAEAPYPGVEALAARAEELLPAVCRRLDADP